MIKELVQVLFSGMMVGFKGVLSVLPIYETLNGIPELLVSLAFNVPTIIISILFSILSLLKLIKKVFLLLVFSV